MERNLIHLEYQGRLNDDGSADSSSAADLERIILHDLPQATQGWDKTRILLYAHGGTVGAKAAIDYANSVRQTYLDAQIYPLYFIWRSDLATSLKSALLDVWNRVTADRTKDIREVLDEALDFAIESVARITVTPLWAKMKDNAQDATNHPVGGARRAAELLAQLARTRDVELHLVGHSAGGIFHAPLVRHLTEERSLPVISATLWAPGTRMDAFRASYLPAFESGALKRFALYTLSDADERDDAIVEPGRNITLYRKSILYLVSNALEGKERKNETSSGRPILGMSRYVATDETLIDLFDKQAARTRWVKARLEPAASTAKRHGDFDNDATTIASTIAWIKH